MFKCGSGSFLMTTCSSAFEIDTKSREACLGAWPEHTEELLKSDRRTFQPLIWADWDESGAICFWHFLTEIDFMVPVAREVGRRSPKSGLREVPKSESGHEEA